MSLRLFLFGFASALLLISVAPANAGETEDRQRNVENQNLSANSPCENCFTSFTNHRRSRNRYRNPVVTPQPSTTDNISGGYYRQPVQEPIQSLMMPHDQ
jgi:hypothetical protein